MESIDTQMGFLRQVHGILLVKEENEMYIPSTEEKNGGETSFIKK